MDQKQKSGWIFWTALALALVFVVYPLNVGPFVSACAFLIVNGWIDPERGDEIGTVFCAPINWLEVHGPPPVQDAIAWYAEFWVRFIPEEGI